MYYLYSLLKIRYGELIIFVDIIQSGWGTHLISLVVFGLKTCFIWPDRLVSSSSLIHFAEKMISFQAVVGWNIFVCNYKYAYIYIFTERSIFIFIYVYIIYIYGDLYLYLNNLLYCALRQSDGPQTFYGTFSSPMLHKLHIDHALENPSVWVGYIRCGLKNGQPQDFPSSFFRGWAWVDSFQHAPNNFLTSPLIIAEWRENQETPKKAVGSVRLRSEVNHDALFRHESLGKGCNVWCDFAPFKTLRTTDRRASLAFGWFALMICMSCWRVMSSGFRGIENPWRNAKVWKQFCFSR